VNLLDPHKTSLIRDMDIIFCRNVIIYFDRDAKKKVIGSFYDKLREGGFLLLGHSETLINLSTAFALRTLKNDMVYQKPVRARRDAEEERT
jgi:chemotaxis protein methyltransferase CheR